MKKATYYDISKRKDYERLCELRNKGRLLTPDGIRLICAAYDYDAEKIGKHFLSMLPKLEEEDRRG